MENIGSIIGLGLLLIWFIVSVVQAIKTINNPPEEKHKKHQLELTCHITQIIKNK